MSLVFFLSIFALFLFFFANFILSPERNPRFIKLMEAEHAPSQEVVNVIVGFCNAVGIVLAAVLVLAVPFFRVLAAIVMAVMAVWFFYRRLVCGPENFAWTDQDPRPNTPDTAPVHVYESNAGEESPGTGGGTAH